MLYHRVTLCQLSSLLGHPPWTISEIESLLLRHDVVNLKHLMQFLVLIATKLVRFLQQDEVLVLAKFLFFDLALDRKRVVRILDVLRLEDGPIVLNQSRHTITRYHI
jgi:hypothetical protein